LETDGDNGGTAVAMGWRTTVGRNIDKAYEDGLAREVGRVVLG
jgi:hypothetical protein